MTVLTPTADSAEYVCSGHPDKLCDLIADSIVDEFLAHDPRARVGCEVLAGKDLLVISGEITSAQSPDIQAVARQTLKEIGYSSPDVGISSESCRVILSLSAQSADLNRALLPLGPRGMMAAGDQAIVVGYAEGNRFGSIPAASFIAKRTAIELGTRRRSGEFSFLRPDGKVLACIRCANEVPTHADRIVISVQHDTNYDRAEICSAIKAMCQQLWGNEPWYDDHTIIEINPPNGAFCFGGPQADAGVTGRKLVAEAYGPKVPHGGGALSGKDPTKIDRCGAYAARWVAKSLVASGVAQAVIVRLTYVIGTYAPVQIDVRALDPHNSLDEQLVDLVRAEFDLRPGAIIERLGLSRPIYRNATLSAHYGIDPELPWEVARTDLMKFRSRTVREVAASALFTEQHQPSQDAVRCLDAVPHRWT